MPDTSRLTELIAADFYGQRLDLSARGLEARAGWEQMPAEVEATRRFRERGAPERSIRRFLTFVSAMDYQRPATALWRAGAALFESNPAVFDPSAASTMPFESLQKLLRVSRVSQKHQRDS